jgi:hypothetical protein
MQLYYDGSGNLLQAIPEEVYQGSANANTVYFIGAFPNNCVVAIAYRLPNGDITEQQLLSLVTETELTNVQTPSGQSFNVWKRTLDKIVTENYGTATIQFFVYDGAANANAQANALATQTYSFNVLKGVPYLLPDDLSTGSDLLTEILDALSAFGDVYEYRTEAVNAATQAQASATVASESATQAASSATAAAQSETNAQTAETNATQSATQAQDSATSALNSANAAALSAIQAQNAATQNAKDIDNIYTLLGATVTDEYPLSQAYSTRETADGNADIIDGALTRVTKIQGATVAVDGTLKNAFFKGIRSTGKNLIKFPYSFTTYTVNGITFTAQSDGGIKVTGTTLAGVTAVRNLNRTPLKGVNIASSNGVVKAQNGFTISGGKDGVTVAVNAGNGLAYMYVSGGKTVDTVIYPMFQYGELTATEYKPYKADESFMLDEAVPLGAWDYIDVQEENGIISATIIKQTATATSETAFTEEQLAEYTDYVLSADGLTVAYKAQSIIDEQSLAIPTDKYKSWVHGSETQVQGDTADTDNSADGANCEITQDYYTQKGA